MPAEPPANPTVVGSRGGFFCCCESANDRHRESGEGYTPMSYISAGARLFARRWGSILILPSRVVCSSYEPSNTIEVHSPGTVADLAVSATTDASATLSFSQVDDGTGQPARYEVRYAAGSTMS